MKITSHDEVEDDLDKEFFRKNVPKMKLNKGEKRALKFALKKGVDVNQVDDLKSFLNSEMKQQKDTGSTKHMQSEMGSSSAVPG